MKALSRSMIIASGMVALLFLTSRVSAQTTAANTVNFNIGFEAADPTGNARIGSNLILGGTARLQYGISNSFAVTLTSGAFHFLSKDRPGTDIKFNSYGVIPIKAGVKEFFLPNIYFGAEAGIGLEITDSGWGQKKFDVSPAIGYANTHWDFGIHYDNLSGTNDTYGVLGVRIAYGFKL